MNLSEHFTLEELTCTSTGIDNTCPDDLMPALTDTAQKMEGVRAALGGHPIKVNSGYRCPAVNKAVGGSTNSAHMQARAVDFTCPDVGTPLDVCKKLSAAGIKFDQLIEEGTWCHISFDPQMRQQVMTKEAGNKYAAGLTHDKTKTA